MLKSLQAELQKQNNDLTQLSRQAAESKTELQTLKQNIDKERRIHRRQVWQNRIWCLLVGAGIGLACK
jgi:FtsZ-binding cell division protein ZapB